MSDSELHQQITAIAKRFQLFECIQCATAIKEFLISQKIHSKIVTIYTGSTKKPFGNIYHDGLQQNTSNLYSPIQDLGSDFQITETDF